MVGQTKHISKSNSKRISTLLDFIGCIPCILTGISQQQDAEYHHVCEGFKRLGHETGYSQCAWHHRAVIPLGSNKQFMLGTFGPSLALSKRDFVEHYGSEAALVRTADFAVQLQQTHQFTGMGRVWMNAIRRYHRENADK
jgi:hypothetical protein